jgi:hypothetical protein
VFQSGRLVHPRSQWFESEAGSSAVAVTPESVTRV